jgi:UDP-N-acetylmuramate dehydrogenase
MKRTIDFSRYSSIKIGPVADVTLIDRVEKIPRAWFVIGGANNLLVSPDPGPLAMLSKKFDYIRLEGDRLIIGGAAKSGRIFSFVKKYDIGSFEYLGKLPGTLGGLVYMNAGMKEDEIFNHLISIKTAEGELPKSAIPHGYRYTEIETLIFEATFRVRRGFDRHKLADFTKMRANQPSDPSPGSAFKNPPGDYAGRLIEAVGMKGARRGDVAFSPVHANFLVNLGSGSYSDAVALMEEARRRVLDQFGIRLENEVRIVRNVSG